MVSPAKEKYAAIKRLLEQEYVLVHVNVKAEGVDLPEHLLKAPTVTLKLSNLFRGPLKVDQRKVVAELLFGETYFRCTIPLEAIWGTTSTSGETTLWPQNVPAEVLGSLILQEKATKKVEDEEPLERAEPLKARGHLRRVK